jgi:hypothetical protein
MLSPIVAVMPGIEVLHEEVKHHVAQAIIALLGDGL